MSIDNKKFLERCKSKKCFNEAGFNEEDFKSFQYNKPTEFINHFWNLFEDFKTSYLSQNNKPINNSIPGQAYGIILTYLFDREEIQIKFMDENIDIKFIKPDFLFINGDNHLFLSVKTSGRERWKQAEQEATNYKQKYPNARCVLLMHHEKEVNVRQKDIPDLKLDDIIYSGSEKFNELITSIKNL